MFKKNPKTCCTGKCSYACICFFCNRNTHDIFAVRRIDSEDCPNGRLLQFFIWHLIWSWHDCTKKHNHRSTQGNQNRISKRRSTIVTLVNPLIQGSFFGKLSVFKEDTTIDIYIINCFYNANIGHHKTKTQMNTATTYDDARSILGNDFISPEEMSAAYDIIYTEDQLKNFGDTLPDKKTLRWYLAHNYMLVAGPPMELNLLQVRKLDNNLFDLKTKGWYAESDQKFAQNNKVTAGEWLAIRKGAAPNSFSKTWSRQQHLITEDEYVPNIPTVSYAVTAYFKVRGIYLLCDKYVRTSSISADFNPVIVGRFGEDGLRVYDCWEGEHSGGIGVASARKL